MKFYFLPVVLMILWIWTGCNMINPPEQTPTYVQIDSFRFVSTADTFGTTSHKISSVWVYFDNEPLGAYEMPVTVPVITDKPGVISVAPAIDMNGQKSFKYPYPFYAFDSLRLTPDPGKVVRFDARTRYTSTTRMVFNSTFDFGNPFTRYAGDTSLFQTQVPEYVFEGTGGGMIYLNRQHQVSENISLTPFSVSASQQTFLEINYKGTLPFQVGVAAFFNNGSVKAEYLSGVYARAEWNKIYIGLREFIGANQGGTYYLLIRAATEKGESSGWVAIDNVKIVSF